jgi:DNA-binding response OmpR family regulator
MLKERTPQVPVIMISSSPPPDSDKVSLADLFLCKPLELKLIREGINNLLRGGE